MTKLGEKIIQGLKEAIAYAKAEARPSVSKSDDARLDAMTDEEITAAALSDPDAQPLRTRWRSSGGVCRRPVSSAGRCISPRRSSPPGTGLRSAHCAIGASSS